MDETGTAHVAGACAAIGGSAWTAATVIHASQPRGCVGDECVGLAMRDATPATSLLVAVAAVMMVASGAGLLQLVRRRGRLGWTGAVGATACAVGIVLLALATALQEIFYDGDFAWMPVFVGPGVIALAVGLALVGWTIRRSRVVPSWAGVCMLVGALLLLGANEQTAAVLLAAPFGLAWLATGAALLSGRSWSAPAAEVGVRGQSGAQQ